MDARDCRPESSTHARKPGGRAGRLAHRQLGVHVSKVRSATLDVKVWTPSVIDFFRRMGNAKANAVWCGEEATAATSTTTSRSEDKAEYAKAKYVGRAFVSHPSGGGGLGWDPTADLKAAVMASDVPRGMLALARGADINASNALHLAAAMGDEGAVEMFLSQHGVDVHARDGDGSTALHVAVANGRDAVAKQVLCRGARASEVNGKGVTALRMLASHSRARDDELFAMLTERVEAERGGDGPSDEMVCATSFS